MKVLLDFAYTGYVDWTPYGDCKQEVLKMATNYQITELKRQAEEQLVSDITPQTFTELVVLADSHSCKLLKKVDSAAPLLFTDGLRLSWLVGHLSGLCSLPLHQLPDRRANLQVG